MADKTLQSALLAARKKMKDPRLSGDNPHFRSKFVPRDEVLDVVVPVLLDEGILLSQGIFDGMLATTVHGHGESLVLGEYPLPPMTDPQKHLAACTYASRGSLMLAFALAGDPDDDGNAASAKSEPKPDMAKMKAQFDVIMTAAEADETYRAAVIRILGTDEIDGMKRAFAKMSAAERVTLELQAPAA